MYLTLWCNTQTKQTRAINLINQHRHYKKKPIYDKDPVNSGEAPQVRKRQKVYTLKLSRGPICPTGRKPNVHNKY